MNKYVLTFCSISLLLTANSASARCSGFDKEAGLLKKTAEAICDVIPGQNSIKVATCGSIDKATNLGKELISFWNDTANNGPAKIGPRDLVIGREDHGKLVNPGGRLWIVDKPVSGDKKVKISYRDGKAGAMVDICKVDAKGNVKYLAYIDIPKKSKKGGSKTVKIKDGGWLLIDMKGQGGLAKSYSYGIEVSRTN